MLLRYLASHNEYGKQEWEVEQFFRPTRGASHEQLHTICGIAFQGILKEEFIFDDLASDFNTLDLMQSASELYVDQRGCGVTTTSSISHCKSSWLLFTCQNKLADRTASVLHSIDTNVDRTTRARTTSSKYDKSEYDKNEND